MRTFCLSVHAAYACRHAGACCTERWTIPIEPHILRQLRTRSAIAEILDRTHGGPYVGRRDDGACVFFESNRDRLCTIHRVAGPDLLPSACRHFPRVVLRDPRGTFITLSGFCPTVAEMLLAPTPLHIVEAPPSLALNGTLDGLDATAVLPPLLRPGLLMDYDGYDAWERAAIMTLDRDDLTVDDALAVIRVATEDVQEWRPGEESLAARVQAAFARSAMCARREGSAESRPARMFMAAHLFGSWAAYQNVGLMAVVDAVRDAVALLNSEVATGASFIEAVRHADLTLRHKEKCRGGDQEKNRDQEVS
jgi:Fe-S-cluster containining protein